MKINAAMVSTFGPNVRGVSPYADELTSALVEQGSIDLTRIDYKRPFPSFILPKGTSYAPDNDYATLDYCSPSTWKLTDTKSFHIVHFQYWSPAFLPIILAATAQVKKAGAKIVVTWHNPSPHESIPFMRFLEHQLLSRTDLIICHNKTGAAIVEQLAPNCRVEVCHHGCRIDPLEQSSPQDYQRTGLDKNNNYLLFFGNIRPYKGVDILLKAWETLRQKFPDYRLIIAGRLWGRKQFGLNNFIHNIAGTSSYANEIEKKLRELPDVIADLNFISEEKLVSYLRIAKLVVFPYTSFESQSGAATRIAGHGLPIITTDVGGLTDLIVDGNYQCRSEDATALATCITNCIALLNPQVRDKQLARARQFTWQSTARSHIDLYNDIWDVHPIS